MDGGIPAGYPYYSSPPRPQKSTMIAGGCSSVLPGLGQVYNGETAKGFAIFILFLAGLVILLIPGVIVWFYALYDAYAVAGKMNSGEIPFRETRALHMVLFIVFALIVIVAAVLIIIVTVITPMMSQFGSMDSLNTGDYNKLINSYGQI
jgi:TM2 domain-containing membrane protein YozV